MTRRSFEHAARRRPGGPHPGHAEGGGRLRQLLHLLHHPLRPGAGALPAPGPPPWSRRSSWPEDGLPGDRPHRHRDLLLGSGAAGTAPGPHRPGGGHLPCRARICGVRLGSLEPRTITEDFCRRAAALPNLCPHFHLSMQSGCDAVLARMNRKYDSARYYESVQLLHGYFDRPAITTDLIVGFPGETEEEFTADPGHSSISAPSPPCTSFPTPSAPALRRPRCPTRCLNAVKEERARRAAETSRRDGGTPIWPSGWVQTVPVLFEEEQGGLWRGHTAHYCAVAAPSPRDLHNCLVQVQLEGLEGNTLKGVVL